MTTKSSTACVQPVKASESPVFLVRKTAHAVEAVSTAIESRAEPSSVVHVSFGEWLLPSVDHPDSSSIQDFVASLEAEGYGETIQQGRRSLASWIDKKATLRTLRLAAGLSQEQLAAIMDTSQPQIARLESGRQDLSLSTMKRLSVALNVDIHEILDAARG